MTTLVKTTQDGRKLEVIGLAICLDGELEAFELIEVKMHPNRRAISAAVPDATYMAGRVTLTREEAEIVIGAFKAGGDRDSREPRRDQRALPDRGDVEGPRAGYRIDADRSASQIPPERPITDKRAWAAVCADRQPARNGSAGDRGQGFRARCEPSPRSADICPGAVAGD